MAVTSKKILDANISTCAVAGTAEEVSSFIQAVDGKANVSDFSTSTPASYVTDFVQKSVRYQKVTPSNTALAEACINVLTTAGQTYTLPTLATGESRVRDLLLYVNTSATAFAINFPTGTQLLGDNPSITEAGEYIITMTAMPSGKWYVRKIKMEVAQ